jgi:hypothetical protein
MGEFTPFEIAAIVFVVGGLTALLLEIAIRSPRSLLDIIDDLERFAAPADAAEAPQPHAEDKPAAKPDSDDPRMAA